jgi:hypothetical protein
VVYINVVGNKYMVILISLSPFFGFQYKILCKHNVVVYHIVLNFHIFCNLLLCFWWCNWTFINKWLYLLLCLSFFNGSSSLLGTRNEKKKWEWWKCPSTCYHTISFPSKVGRNGFHFFTLIFHPSLSPCPHSLSSHNHIL